MGNKKFIPFFLLATITFTTGCQDIQNNATNISEKLETKKEKEVVDYTTIADVLSSKNFDIITYKEFIGNLIMRANVTSDGKPNVTKKEIEDRIKLNDNKSFENAPDDAKKVLKEATKQSIALQKIIDNSINAKDLASINRNDYKESYLIIYYNSTNLELIDGSDLIASEINYIDNFKNEKKFYEDSPLNYGIFTTLINKENSERVNGSYNVVKNMKNNQVHKMIATNEYDKEVFTYFKKVKAVDNNSLYTDRLVYLEAFKKATKGKSKQDTFINMLKFIDNSSKRINISKADYESLLDKLNEFDTENIQEMIDYIINLYIDDYTNINKKYIQ